MSAAVNDLGHPGLPRLLAGLERTRDGAPLHLSEHEAVHGPLPGVGAGELIREVELSGLRGRGGADFPTARKLQAVAGGARRRGRLRTVVVNGSETEPASHKDELLLSRLPHLVLDGAVLAARAVGATEVIVRVSEHATLQLAAVQAALGERRDGGVRLSVSSGGAGYVSGEESAVIHALSGGPPLPKFVPPRPFERGLHGAPTLIQNPETLAQVALVARFGHRWYRELGSPEDPGSALVTIQGAVQHPGVYELAFGTSMNDLVSAAGGATEPLRALLVGGYFGTWIDAAAIGTIHLARADLRGLGATLGSGVLFALGESSCGLHESARVIDYLAEESAGQCGPCVYGLDAIAQTFSELVAGEFPIRAGIDRLRFLFEEVRGRGACHHPGGVIRFAESALRVFARELGDHAGVGCRARPAGLPLAHARGVAHGRRAVPQRRRVTEAAR